MNQQRALPLLDLPDQQEAAKSRLKAFSALASQGAAIIRSRSMPEGQIGASFGEFPGFWRSWSDGAHLPETGQSGMGGVVADESGVAVAAFSLDTSSETGAPSAEANRKGAMLTELRALERSLELAWEAGARKIEARFDCLPLARAAASALMGNPGEADNPESASLLAVMSQFECIALRWIPRGSNRMADALSKRPSGGGIFHGGASQAHMIERAWENPELGLVDVASFVEETRKSRREISRAEPKGLGISKAGVAKIAIGARWSEGVDGPQWIAAASLADPAARRDAKLEPSGHWALGRSAQKGAIGMSAALSQALAKKGAEVASRASGAIQKFSVHIPQVVLGQLEEQGILEDFLKGSVAMLKSLAPGTDAQALSVESSSEVSSRQAAHLLNGWELGRAQVIQELSFARSKKRLDRAKKSVSSRPSGPA
jgi:ribonuclease HI